jgi:hypothetical protein
MLRQAARKLTTPESATVELPASFSAPCQAVKRSSSLRKNIACAADSPHISVEGCRPPQTFGRSGRPKILQPLCSSNCTQRTPAGLPFGMPGMAELIEGAMQQAPQPGRQLTEEVEDMIRTIRDRIRDRNQPAGTGGV